MATIIAALRSGDWISRERIRLWALAVLVASLAGLGYLVLTAHGLNDYKGRPLGTDFSNIYAGGSYTRDGTPALAFDPQRQHAREQALFGADTPFYGWHYPPFLLFVAGVLALLPYLAALVVWQLSTLALYLVMLWRLLASAPAGPGRRTLATEPLWLLAAVASPAVFVNISHGHNGFLTASLIGGGLLLLQRRPILAGVLFGLLAYKPQFGLLIPLALIASLRWRALLSAAATVLALLLISTLAFGPEIWPAFLKSTAFSREVLLEHGGVGWHKIQTAFSWVRMWGGGVDLAYAVQGALTAGLALALLWLWRGAAAFELQAAGLIIAAILATPYSLDYDFVALAPAIGFLAAHGFARGFAPWEKTALALLWLMPLLARGLAEATLIPLGVPSMLLMFALVLRRAAADRGVFARWRAAPQPGQ
jgi:hypothetical protein